MTRGEFKGKLTELLDEYIQDNPMFQPLDETYILRNKKYETKVGITISQEWLEEPDLMNVVQMPMKGEADQHVIFNKWSPDNVEDEMLKILDD